MFSRADYELEIDRVADLEAGISRQVAEGKLSGLQAMQFYRIAEQARRIARNKLVGTRLILADRDRMRKMPHMFLFVIGIDKKTLYLGRKAKLEPIRCIKLTRRKGALVLVNGKWVEQTAFWLAARLQEGVTLIVVKGGFRPQNDMPEAEAIEKFVDIKKHLEPISEGKYRELVAQQGQMVVASWDEAKNQGLYWQVVYE